MRLPSAVPVLALALLPIAAPDAAAQAAQATTDASPPAHSLHANVSLASQYRYRGLAQTDGDPALQGGFDYSHASGLYLGTWGSNVSWLADSNGDVSNSVELDVYGGYRGAWGDVGYDVGVLRYL